MGVQIDEAAIGHLGVAHGEAALRRGWRGRSRRRGCGPLLDFNNPIRRRVRLCARVFQLGAQISHHGFQRCESIFKSGHVLCV